MAKPERLIDRMRALRNRRAELENRISDEMSRPAPDGLRLQTLKRLKLRARDQINLIRQQLGGRVDPASPSAA